MLYTNFCVGQKFEKEWVTYFGGQLTTIHQVLYEPFNNCIYVVGMTADTNDITTSGTHKENFGSLISSDLPPIIIYGWNSDIFLARIGLDGNLIWSTYFGGEGREFLPYIVSDANGNIFLTGRTNSPTGVTTPGSLHETLLYDSNDTKFLVKFNSEGEQIWGTYFDIYEDFSGEFNGSSYIATDDYGNVYLVGLTRSTIGIASPGAYQEAFAGGELDGFITKFDNNGELIWSTYFGGEGNDFISSVYVSKNGQLYIAGGTTSTTGISTTGVFQEYLSDDKSYFLAKIDKNTGNKIWGTYMGSEDYHFISIAADSLGNTYALGTSSIDSGLATLGAYIEEVEDSPFLNLFLMKFDNTGNRIWSTYFKGNDYEVVDFEMLAPNYPNLNHIVLSHDEEYVYFSGYTNSTEGIDFGCGYMTTTGNNRGFIVKFDKNGELENSSYYDEEIHGISLHYDKNKGNELFFVSRTNLHGLATEGSYKETFSTLTSGLIGKLIEGCPTDTVDLDFSFPNLIARDGYEVYEWYHNGILLETTEFSSYTIVDTSGFYYCKVKICGCEYMSDTFSFETSNINDLYIDDEIVIFPNPVKHVFKIKLPNDFSNQPFIILIFDSKGQLCKTINCLGFSSTFEFNVESLPSGIYSIQIIQGEKFMLGKFTKIE